MADAEKKEAAEGENAENENEEGAAEGEGGEGEKKKSPLMLIIFITVPLLLIIGVCVFLFLTSAGKQLIGLEKPEEEVAVEEVVEPVVVYSYYDLPDLLVNIMNPKSRRPIFLKLSVYLEIVDEMAKPELDKIKPRIVDQFQVYLRGLRLEDLQGSAGIQRLRAELLHRAKEAAGTIVINDVLFKEMLIQ